MYYTVFIIFRNRVIECILPSAEDVYKADISAAAGTEKCFISFERKHGEWYAADDEYISVSGSSQLKENAVTEISIKKTSVSAAVLLYEINQDTCIFDRYLLKETTETGNSSGADIIIENELVSRKHALITRDRDGYTVRDLSRNGVYVNGLRIEGEKHLDMLDVIWISGARIIFLGGVIAVSRSRYVKTMLEKSEETVTEKNVRRHKQLIPEEVCDASGAYDISPAVIGTADIRKNERTKRKISDIAKVTVPSSAVLSSAYSVIAGSSVPVLASVFAGVTAVMSGTWLLAENISDRMYRRRIINYNTDAAEKYISECSSILEKKQSDYRSYLNEKYMTAEKLIRMYRDGKRVLRMRSSEEFLKINIGSGTADLRKLISVSAESESAVRKLTEKMASVPDIPVITDFKEEKAFYLTGDTESVTEMMTGAAIKISAVHDPYDVRMMFLVSSEVMEEFSFVRWLPHVYSDDRSARYISSGNGISVTYSALVSLLRSRSESRSSGISSVFYPHYIVFCTSDAVSGDETVRRYLRSDYNLGVTFVFARKSSDKTITVSAGKNTFKAVVTGNPDRNSAVSYARLRAGYSDSAEVSSPVPVSLDFLEMFGYEKTDQINLRESYRRNRASEGIKALIGCGADDSKFVLDIHESAHGPHGLVAGTTGSGKSEAIQTFILSLAVRYSPDEIAFVLIDYKGGGMSGAFEHLPHTAGVLTNLSDNGSSVWRSLVSVRSEIKRRQQIFREYGVNHVDRYMEYFRSGNAGEPVPHLIIICDEFAELRREQPEFISQLVSISRVGRSLGVHLILATQKPSGVVDDEIWSNSAFRICLKVQDRADSMEMLRRTDAADIQITGRACIQIGNDEIFEMIQTGYTGAEYNPENEKYDVHMVNYDNSESICRSVKKRKNSITQLQAVTDYITEYCAAENIRPARKLWNDPLPDMPYLSDISAYGETDYDDGLICSFGIADDPENQDMYPAVTDIYGCGNIIISGMSGSGKTTLVGTMICSLAQNYSEKVFSFSVIDLSGGLFSVYRRLPQCEHIMTSPEERETAEFISDISDETERRKRAFAEVHAADFSEYRELKDDINAKIIFIDGYYIFRELYPALEEKFTRLCGESAKYGLYFIVTVKQPSDMKMRTRQNFHTVISLAMNDRTDYAELLGVRPDTELSGNTGRGYIKNGRRLLEFQTAVCCTGTGREKLSELASLFDSIIKIRNNTEEIIRPEKSFCSFVKAETDSQYMSLAETLAAEERVIIWSSSEIQSGKNPSGTEVFTGSAGAFEMLLTLKHIFSERNMKRKISGKSDGESIAVIICGLDRFCSCIYSEGREDMSRITETFFRDGSGLGIRFVSGVISDKHFSESEAFRIFSSYSKGEDNAKSLCV